MSSLVLCVCALDQSIQASSGVPLRACVCVGGGALVGVQHSTAHYMLRLQSCGIRGVAQWSATGGTHC